MAALRPALPDRPPLGQNPLHRALRTQVDAFVQQRRVHHRGSAVREARRAEHVEDFATLRLDQRPGRLGPGLPLPGLARLPATAERGARNARGRARHLHVHLPGQLCGRGQEDFPSPRLTPGSPDTFPCTSMTRCAFCAAPHAGACSRARAWPPSSRSPCPPRVSGPASSPAPPAIPPAPPCATPTDANCTTPRASAVLRSRPASRRRPPARPPTACTAARTAAATFAENSGSGAAAAPFFNAHPLRGCRSLCAGLFRVYVCFPLHAPVLTRSCHKPVTTCHTPPQTAFGKSPGSARRTTPPESFQRR